MMDPWDEILNNPEPPKVKKETVKKRPITKHSSDVFLIINLKDLDDMLKDIINDKEVGKYTAGIKTKVASIEKKPEKVYSLF